MAYFADLLTWANGSWPICRSSNNGRSSIWRCNQNEIIRAGSHTCSQSADETDKFHVGNADFMAGCHFNGKCTPMINCFFFLRNKSLWKLKRGHKKKEGWEHRAWRYHYRQGYAADSQDFFFRFEPRLFSSLFLSSFLVGFKDKSAPISFFFPISGLERKWKSGKKKKRLLSLIETSKDVLAVWSYFTQKNVCIIY